MSDDKFKTYLCILCGFVYNEELGLPNDGIPSGTLWQDVPETWICPDCSATKSCFEMLEI